MRNQPELQTEERKNDGSFKKHGSQSCDLQLGGWDGTTHWTHNLSRWLLGAGFEASALFDRNKCLVRLPRLSLAI